MATNGVVSDEFISAIIELKALRENIKHTQQRCNELLEENRGLRGRCSKLEATIRRVIGFEKEGS